MSQRTSNLNSSGVAAEAPVKKKKKKKSEEDEQLKEQIRQQNMEKVLTFEEAFSKIEEATNIRDPDVLTTTFIANEERNFALFTFIN